MGFWDTITDLVEAAAPWSTAEAEAPESAPEESKVRSSIALYVQSRDMAGAGEPLHTAVGRRPGT